MAKLTQDQWEVAKAWLHDVFMWGGLITTPKRPYSIAQYSFMYGGNNPKYNPDGTKAAQTICDAIKFRIADYKKMVEYDAALTELSRHNFIQNLQANASWRNAIRKKPEMLARYLANFCAQNNIWWNNTNTTSYEMDEIKNTMLGKELWENQCFTSQGAKQKAAKATASSSSGSASSSSGTSSAPQNGYKSSGAQSGNMKCLVGQPNQKLGAQSPVSFCIIADKLGKNTPNAFIKPLDDKACPGGVATVYFGSGNGYTDCTCWFDDLNDATNFLALCQTKFGGKYTNIRLSKAKSDANGYFVAKTEFGDCGIKASKLNEQLGEELTEEVKDDADEAPAPCNDPRVISPWRLDESTIEAYSEAFYKYE